MPEMKSVEYLRNIETTILASRQFCGLVILKVNKIIENIDRIYAALPTDTLEARKTNQSFDINPNTYNDLKRLEILLDNSMYLFGFYRIIKISEISSIIRSLYEDLGVISLY